MFERIRGRKLCQVHERGACSKLSLLVAGRRWFCSHPLSGVDVDSHAHFEVHGKNRRYFNTTCDAASDVQLTYSGFSMAAVFTAHSCSGSPFLELTVPYSINPVIHDEDQSGVPCWTQVTTKVLLVHFLRSRIPWLRCLHYSHMASTTK